MDAEALNMLELELRQVPGILGIGVEEFGPALVLHLLTGAISPHAMILRAAAEIVSNHVEGLTVLSLLTPFAPPAPTLSLEEIRLLSTSRAEGPGEDEAGVTVELSWQKRVCVGRAEGAGPRAAALATLGALADLGVKVPFVLKAALRVLGWLDGQVVVIVALTAPTGPERLGVAQASTVDEAATLAVLQAVGGAGLAAPERTPLARER